MNLRKLSDIELDTTFCDLEKDFWLRSLINSLPLIELFFMVSILVQGKHYSSVKAQQKVMNFTLFVQLVH